jgi:hypothetical protein
LLRQNSAAAGGTLPPGRDVLTRIWKVSCSAGLNRASIHSGARQSSTRRGRCGRSIGISSNRSGRRSCWSFFLDLLAALSEVALAKFLADLIDLLKATANPAALFPITRGCCFGWRSSC